ncbi:hypothetical protein [Stenotrophomonas maltophilia]|uniref:hypothetical protein n=1 Tax=Stenotrophomonas maltophilia TaxID=40324 RepID=UPI0021C76172|nr:hypothetical protein [Stenotrophomonas maltophilia]MCU0998359.1 hypothetical protein [Stenotrophomonas maltophilia]
MGLIQPDIVSGIATFSSLKDAKTWKVGQLITIGKIITSKGEEVESLVLEPQGIAHLVSAESVSLPSDVCAFAHVLTRKCNEGLLTLNIGVIDPGWDNKLSSPILNFSSEKRLLAVGQEFIRITFHKLDGAPPESPLLYTNPSPSAYLQGIRERSVGSFGKHFLNIRKLVGQASKKESAQFRDALLKYLPIAAFSLAVFALLVTIGGAAATRALTQGQADSVSALQERAAALEQEIAKIRAIEASSSSVTHDSQPMRIDGEKIESNETLPDLSEPR